MSDAAEMLLPRQISCMSLNWGIEIAPFLRTVA